MRPVWGTALVLLLAAAARPADDGMFAAPRIDDQGRILRDEEFTKRLDETRARGVAWLESWQSRDGGFGQVPTGREALTALACVSLTACDARRDSESAARAFAALRRMSATETEEMRTAAAAWSLVAIVRRRGAPARGTEGGVTLDGDDRRRAEELTACLLAGRGEGGAWGPDVPRRPAPRKAAALLAVDPDATLATLLALREASACGFDVPSDLWKAALRNALDGQDADGVPVARRIPPQFGVETPAPQDRARGWRAPQTSARLFAPTSPVSEAATGAAVSRIALARSALLDRGELSAELEAESARALRDGIAWLGEHPRGVAMGDEVCDLPADPRIPRGSAATNWAVDPRALLARNCAGRLTGVEWMAGIDWYGEIATALRWAQRGDGSWTVRSPQARWVDEAPIEDLIRDAQAERTDEAIEDACRCLLALTRVLDPVRRGALLPAADAEPLRDTGVRALTGEALDRWLDRVFVRWRRAEEPATRERTSDLATSVGPGLVPALLRRMDSAESAERTVAISLLRRATGEDFGFDPDSPRADREEAVAKWQAWWIGVEPTLHYDGSKKRLVP